MEIRRAYKNQESLVRYWAEQAVALCADIEDEGLEEYAEAVRAAANALQVERRVVVIGGRGSGKSAVLAGMVEVPVLGDCRMEGEYICWRYCHREGADETHARFLPLEWLAGLELVDTAACDGEGREVCRELMQGADVVVAVVDGRSPAESPVWGLLAELPEEERRGCLLAVTHADMLAGEEAVMLKSTLQQLEAEFSQPLPVFLVSPGKAEGCRALRTKVEELLREPLLLRAAIRGLAERAIELVEKQSRVLRRRHSASLTDHSFISTIDSEIDNFLTRQMGEVDKLQLSLSEAVDKVIPPVLQAIRDTLGWVLSPTVLLRLELMGVRTDQELYTQIVDRVKSEQEMLDHNFTLTCAGHWRVVSPRMKKTLDFEIGEFPEGELADELSELRNRLCQDLYEPFASTKLRHSFCRLFVAQAGWMRMCLIFVCFLLVTAGTLGYIGQDVLGACCVAAAVMVWMLGSVGHHRAYYHIAHEVKELAEKLRLDMEIAMRPVLERLIISRVTAYRQLYTKPRQKVARREDLLRPLQDKQRAIHIQLRTLIPRL